MNLFDQRLEERLAASCAVDSTVLEYADDLECADFVTPRASWTFAHVRNAQARHGGVVTPDRVLARAIESDRRRGAESWPLFTTDALWDLLVDSGGPYETVTETIHAVRRLRALRVRRENVLALADMADAEKRAAAQAERERQFGRSA